MNAPTTPRSGVTSIVTAHAEGAYIALAVRSAEAAIARARENHPDWQHERLLVLDRPDEASRRAAAGSWGVPRVGVL